MTLDDLWLVCIWCFTSYRNALKFIHRQGLLETGIILKEGIIKADINVIQGQTRTHNSPLSNLASSPSARYGATRLLLSTSSPSLIVRRTWLSVNHRRVTWRRTSSTCYLACITLVVLEKWHLVSDTLIVTYLLISKKDACFLYTVSSLADVRCRKLLAAGLRVLLRAKSRLLHHTDLRAVEPDRRSLVGVVLAASWCGAGACRSRHYHRAHHDHSHL